MPDRPVHGLDSLALGESGVPILLRKRVVIALAAAFCALAVGYLVAAQVFGISLAFDAEPFRDWVDGFGILGPVVFIVVMALSVLFAPIPNVPIFIAAGLAWGPFVGTAYSMAGLTLGSAMAFYAARYFGRGHLRRLVGQRNADRLDDLATTMGGRVIFWSRVLPAVNFDWISFVAGMTAMPFRVFIIYSFLGMLGPTALTVAAGDSLSGNPAVTLGLVGLWIVAVLLSAAFFWWRRRSARPPMTTPASSADSQTECGNRDRFVRELPILRRSLRGRTIPPAFQAGLVNMNASQTPRYLRLITPFACEGTEALSRPPAGPVPVAARGRFRTDPLCGVATRQVLLERLDTLGELAPQAPLSFLVVKLEGLTALNHELGFRSGDAALQSVAQCVSELTRATDMVGRLAGSTFGVVLQSTGVTAAGAVAARLSHHLGQLQSNGRQLRVTVSAATGTGIDAATLPHAAADSLGDCG